MSAAWQAGGRPAATELVGADERGRVGRRVQAEGWANGWADGWACAEAQEDEALAA